MGMSNPQVLLKRAMRKPQPLTRKNNASTTMGATGPPSTSAFAPATGTRTPTRSTKQTAPSQITEIAGASHRNDEAGAGTPGEPPIVGNGKAKVVGRRGRPPKAAVDPSSSSSKNTAHTTQAAPSHSAPVRRSTRVQNQNTSQVSAILNPAQSPAPSQSTLGTTENGTSTAREPVTRAKRTPTSTKKPVQNGDARQTKMTSYLNPGDRRRS